MWQEALALGERFRAHSDISVHEDLLRAKRRKAMTATRHSRTYGYAWQAHRVCNASLHRGTYGRQAGG